MNIHGVFTTQGPLSHIAEAQSTHSFLVQEPIVQDDGTVEEVFCYSGNAWRGQMRDLAATYLVERLQATLTLDTFHLLFSGGKIGGEQSIDINQAKTMRNLLPMVGLFGGGVGNQIMQGKLKVGNSYIICQQSVPVLDIRHHPLAHKLDYADLTFEKSFTRFDDGKNLANQAFIDGESTEQKTQMRVTSELVVAGAKLAHDVHLCQVNDIELGVWVSALYMFAQAPYIGGQSNKGHGRVNYECYLGDDEFVTIIDGKFLLSDKAQQAKQAYDAQIDELRTKLDDKAMQKQMGVLCTSPS